MLFEQSLNSVPLYITNRGALSALVKVITQGDISKRTEPRALASGRSSLAKAPAP
jgi:hypothetical protein